MYNKMQFQNSQAVSNVLQKDGETSEVLMKQQQIRHSVFSDNYKIYLISLQSYQVYRIPH